MGFGSRVRTPVILIMKYRTFPLDQSVIGFDVALIEWEDHLLLGQEVQGSTPRSQNLSVCIYIPTHTHTHIILEKIQNDTSVFPSVQNFPSRQQQVPCVDWLKQRRITKCTIISQLMLLLTRQQYRTTVPVPR